jgi:glycine betaine catabolism B
MALGIHTLAFAGRDDVGAGAVALRFTARRPLRYVAGQHALWLVPGGGAAPFTIASAPGEEHVVLATNPGRHSRLKRALGALAPGDRVRLAGPLSSFTLDGAGGEVVMLAQGIGVTPFRAMLAAAPAVSTTLVHAGAAAGHPYRADTEATAGRALYPTGRAAFGRCLDTVVADRPAATYLVAGTREFAAATAGALAGRGVDRRRIRRDAFHGWSGPRP